MRIVVHIGAHKTGTSSIQATMHHSTQALAEFGVLYPDCCRHDAAHHRLPFAMKGKLELRNNEVPDLESELRALSTVLESSAAHTALLSSEEFFTAPSSSIKLFAEGLKGHETEIVAFVRRPDDMVESAFNQRLKQIYGNFAKETGLGYYIDDFIENPESIIPDIDYNRFVSRWIDAFGLSRVRLVQYEVSDAVTSMCDILRIDPSALASETRRENPRASEKTLSILRLAREAGASVKVQEIIRELAWNKFPPKQGGDLLASRDRAAILRKYKKGNDELFRMLLDQNNPYDPDLLPVEQKESDHSLRMRDLMQVIIDLIEANRRRSS